MLVLKDVKIDIIDHIDKLDTEEVVIAWGSLPKLLSRENRSNLNDIIKKIEEKIIDKALMHFEKISKEYAEGVKKALSK